MIHRRLFLAASSALMLGGARAEPVGGHFVKDLKITILSTGIGGGPGAGAGEWGFSALVEADGARILYDTGGQPDLVLRNSRALHLDLAGIGTVVLSHNHPDHVGGLLTLRAAFQPRNRAAFSRAVVGEGAFLPRRLNGPVDRNSLNGIRKAYEETGGVFESYAHPGELAPGVWLTGPVPRLTGEHNWQDSVKLASASGAVADDIPEESALVIATIGGLVVLTGCGHAGIVNITAYARKIGAGAPVAAIVGGLHLAEATPGTVDWTARELRKAGVKTLLTGHCTGLAATDRLREQMHLTRATAAMGAVGSTFTPAAGITQPLSAL